MGRASQAIGQSKALGASISLRRAPHARLVASMFPGRMFDAHAYTVDKASGLLDYDAIRDRAKAIHPLILLAGLQRVSAQNELSHLPGNRRRGGAVLMVDMAHFAGLVAGKVFSGDFDPVAHAHVITTTTHKTLRGPEGAWCCALRNLPIRSIKAAPWCSAGLCPM